MGSNSDDDFDDLDDYLDEFDNDVLDAPFNGSKQTESAANADSKQKERPKDSQASNHNDNIDGLSEEELGKQIDDNMALLFGDSYQDPQNKEQLTALMNELAENFDMSKFADSEKGIEDLLNATKGQEPVATKVKGDEKAKVGNNEPVDFKKVISSAMSRLKEQDAKVDKSIKEEQQAKKAQNEQSPEKMLADLLQKMSLEGDKTGNGDNSDDLGLGDFDISKMLVDMVLKLTTKEMLYEPMKNLSVKFPKWFEEHKDDKEVSEEDLKRYKLQQKYVQEIVSIFDRPTYNDNDDGDREEVTKTLEQLQEAGLPPKELMDDYAGVAGPGAGAGGAGGLPGLDFSPEMLNGSIPGIPENTEGCEQQ